MTKRWSSGREDLPIFHGDRPLIESIFILLMITVGLLYIPICVIIFVL